MAPLDSLPADQRAVLALVLGRGRSFDEIARLLSIDRAAVRQRALAAFDSLGPETGVRPERRALITDYLLGQLPPALAEETRSRLAESATERAWARVVSSEVAPLTNGARLPDISVEPSPATSPAPAAGESLGVPDAGASLRLPVAATPLGPESKSKSDHDKAPFESEAGEERNVSRLGGAVLIGIAVVVVAAVVFIVTQLGGSGPGQRSRTSSLAASSRSTATGTATTNASATTGTTTPTTSATTGAASAQVVAQINLTPPDPTSKAAGIAEVLKEGSTDGIAIVAQKVAPNATKPPNAYAVWLYNSPTDAHILGFVNPSVGSSGRLSTAGGLPSSAAHYKELIVTLETQPSPKTPGTIILRGAMKGL
jgi:hypothetical protein